MNHIADLLGVLNDSLFYQLSAILLISGIIGFVALKLHQPLIVAYIGIGLLAGPNVLGVMGHDSGPIDTLAAMGIALLLFMVGLKLDLQLIKRLGPVALITGLSQVFLTALLGFGLSRWLGFDMATAVWFGVALSFSSTIIVVKLLSDSSSIDSLYGKICLGILIVQDIVVIMAMVAVTALGQGGEGASVPEFEIFAGAFVKMCILMMLTMIFVRFIANPLTRGLSRSSELMVIFALGLASMMAALCHMMDLSKELGGLLAGVALASTPLRDVIAARLSPLRDFLLLFFFVGLGAGLDISLVEDQLSTALILSAFVLLGKPLIVMSIMGVMGYRRRTGFLAGLTLSQLSEFSMIYIAVAAEGGWADQRAVGLITLTGMITITLSVYAIIFQDRLYALLERPLGIFERKKPKFEEELPDSQVRKVYDVLIFGLGRFGTAMAAEFKRKGARVLGVDFDPEAVQRAQKAGMSAIYGDAADPEFPKTLPLDQVNTVVLAFPHHATGQLAPDIRKSFALNLRNGGYKGHIAATSHFKAREEQLIQSGIDIVLCPFEDAATHGAGQIFTQIEKDRKEA
jgi:Kef-type K+ transport system membrane component KefB